MMYRIAHTTTTQATVWVRHTSNGVLTLTINGQTFTGSTIDTAVADGTGLVTATGLSAWTQYPFTLSVGGSPIHTGTLRTMPESGASFSLLWAYCWHPFRPAFAIEQAMRKHDDIAAFFMAGDNIYSDYDTSTSARSGWGETLKNIGAIMQADPNNPALAEAGLRAMYRARFREPCTRAAAESYPTYPMVSDHDMNTGDNWDANHTTAAANAYVPWASTQAQAVAVWEKHKSVFWEYYQGAPENTHALRDATLATNRQMYFDFVVGDVHVFCLDANNYKDRTVSGDYGATQLAWLLDRLSASTATWKMIATGEGITEFSVTVSNDHQAIIDHITTNGITGAFLIAGDIHAPYMGEYGIPQLRPGQVSQANHTNIPNGWPGGARYKWLGYASNGVTGDIGPHAVGVLRVTPDRLDVDYLDSEGNVFWHGYMLPTDRVMRHDRMRIA